MNPRARRSAWVCLAAVIVAACMNRNAQLSELQRVKANDVDVVLLSAHDSLRHGQDSFVIEFRSPSGSLVDVGPVKAIATMPMSGVPMFGALDVTATTTPGRYEVVSKFEMAGTWRIKIEWQEKPAGRTATFVGSVQ